MTLERNTPRQDNAAYAKKSAQGGTRTRTGLLPAAFKAAAAAGYATWACVHYIMPAKNGRALSNPCDF